MTAKLLSKVRTELKDRADAAKAPQMQAYMKSEMPYHGVSSPLAKQAFRAAFEGVALPDAAAWQAATLYLWRNAKFREERYGALHLAGDKRFRAHQTPDAMPLYEELIVTGAWWDYVDDIASHRVGPIVASHPTPMKRLMRRWSRDADLWKRRTSIICQLGFKDQIDLDLLYECIAPSLDSKAFFLRKAIGWALRQHAWIDSAEVVRYVREHKDELSPLSKREALKNVLRAGKIKAIP